MGAGLNEAPWQRVHEALAKHGWVPSRTSPGVWIKYEGRRPRRRVNSIWSLVRQLGIPLPPELVAEYESWKAKFGAGR